MTADELAHAWFENVWNKRSDEFVHKHMCCPCTIHGLPEEASNPEGFIQFRDSFLAAISDMHVEVTDSIDCGDQTSGHIRVTGKHIRSQKPVDFFVSYQLTVSEDKIIYARNIVDYLTLFQQIDSVPSDVLERALG